MFEDIESDKARVKQLEDLILNAKKAYYADGDSIIEDDEYDALEKELRELSPNSKVLTYVGTINEIDNKSVKFPKEKHRVPMGSQSKCANEKEFKDWDRLHNLEKEPILATYKLDGASLNIVYENGQFIKAVTRGNGIMGRKITSNAKKFIGIPQTITIKERLDIRGECILSVENWKEVDPGRWMFECELQ